MPGLGDILQTVGDLIGNFNPQYHQRWQERQNLQAAQQIMNTPGMSDIERMRALMSNPSIQAQNYAGDIARLSLTQNRLNTGLDLPATIQIANEIQRALDSEDLDRAILLHQVHKSFDKGVVPYSGPQAGMGKIPPTQGVPGMGNAPGGMASPQGGLADVVPFSPTGQTLSLPPALGSGGATVMPGYGDAVGSIEGAKQKAKKRVDLGYDPEITRQESLAKGRAEEEIGKQKRASSATRTNAILEEAKKILPAATGSGIGAQLNKGKAYFGVSDASTRANERLRMLSGWLVSNVPRMEGPQSNFDVENYKQMAADVGNESKPIKDRLAALEELRKLNEKYASGFASSEEELTPPTKKLMGEMGMPVPGSSGDSELDRLKQKYGLE